jgi:hypothetical protein
MIILLISSALSAVYCLAVWRGTRRLPIRRQRLVRSGLFGLLCPPLFLHDDSATFLPSILYVTFSPNHLKPDDCIHFVIQALIVWGAIYVLWMSIAGFCSPHSNDPVITQRVKLAAIICSAPSWVFIVELVLYRIWIDGKYWPSFGWLFIPFCICLICSLASMTLSLISMNDYSITHADIQLFVWSAFPVCLGIGLGCLLWFSITFGDASLYDYYSRGTQFNSCSTNLCLLDKVTA